MESLIQISKINDFIFCPRSIYFHSLYEKYSQSIYHDTYQTVGKIKHENIEENKYCTSKHILQGVPVYSEKYGLVGKIDIFNKKTGTLVERKYHIKKIYDGYRFQLYAQMFSLEEMGFAVKDIFVQSLKDNKRYHIGRPSNKEINEFEATIKKMRNYNMEKSKLIIYSNKCAKCIYSEMCDQKC